MDEYGLLTAKDVENALREDTGLVSIMYANNEIGTILPIPEIGALCRKKGILFHTDAVQAVGNVKIDVKAQNIDMLSLSAHKLHGPKGVGALYVRKGVVLPNFMDGGAQERGHRAGTENVAGIVGLGVAITDAVGNLEERTARERDLRDQLIHGILSCHPPQPSQRPSHPAAARQRQPLLRRGGGGSPPPVAGHVRHLRFLRFGLYLRLFGPQPCAPLHRPAP